MKFAVSGAHGTGKTTLVELVARDMESRTNGGVVTCREIPRAIAELVGDRTFFQKRNNSITRQLLIMIRQVMEEHEYSASGRILIIDRTLVDHMAYTVCLFPAFVNTTEFGLLFDLIKRWISEFEAVFKLPIEFELCNDGLREEDRDFQRRVDKKIDQLYLDAGVRTISVRGNVDARVASMMRVIKEHLARK